MSGLASRAFAVLTATLIGSLSARAAALTGQLLEAVPGDSVAVIFIDSAEPGPQPSNIRSTLDFTTFLTDRAYRVGIVSMLDESVRIWIDTLASASVASKHPLALVLLDITAKPRPDGGHRLAGMAAALVAYTRGENDAIEQRIRHLLKTYTNSEESRLSVSALTGVKRFVLRDRRLPEWARITWGQFGDYYVVALGDGAYEKIGQTIANASPSLTSQAWFKRASAAIQGPDAFFACYFRFDALQQMADSIMVGKIRSVQTALRLSDVQFGLWTVRRRERAIEVNAFVRRGDRDEMSLIAGGSLEAGLDKQVIPDKASCYTVFQWDPSTVLEGLSAAYLASRSPSARQSMQVFWENLQVRSRVSIPRDILANLGRPLVIHNYPRHVLGLPLAWTILIPIEGDAPALRSALDRLLGFASNDLVEPGIIQLRRDSDGIWYLFVGLSGPALTVTDRWIVVSFSPRAVRRNLALLPSPP